MSATVADRARGWMFDTLAHDQAEQLRIKRELQRKTYGLAQLDLPYPGTVSGNTIVHHNYPPPAAPAAPPVQRVIHIFDQQQPDGTWREVFRTPPHPA